MLGGICPGGKCPGGYMSGVSVRGGGGGVAIEPTYTYIWFRYM